MWVFPGSFSWGSKIQYPAMNLGPRLNKWGRGRKANWAPALISLYVNHTRGHNVTSCVTLLWPHLPYHDSLYPQTVSQNKCSPLIFFPPFTFFLFILRQILTKLPRLILNYYPLALASEVSRTTGLCYQECEFGYIMHSVAIISTQSEVMRRLP